MIVGLITHICANQTEVAQGIEGCSISIKTAYTGALSRAIQRSRALFVRTQGALAEKLQQQHSGS
ncbi:MAG TPA: hypothetical protein VG146_10015, partial [Verrucomicrobiae bacterium]|nr:hypothetical protein [Verrucomicrobiae bacterium]